MKAMGMERRQNLLPESAGEFNRTVKKTNFSFELYLLHVI
jgi:hypothetical protein